MAIEKDLIWEALKLRGESLNLNIQVVSIKSQRWQYILSPEMAQFGLFKLLTKRFISDEFLSSCYGHL